LKIDASYYDGLIHPELSNSIVDAAYNQVLRSPIESTRQEGKKSTSHIEDTKHNVTILKVNIDCK
jgi:hypothetical protein